MREINTKLAMAITVGILLATNPAVHGQSPSAYSRLRTRTIPTALSPKESTPGHRQSPWTSPAMRYFVGERAQAIPQVAPRQYMPLPQPVQIARRTKPFSDLRRPATISPYLALDQLQTGVELPNYYAYVRPMLRQQQANKSQRVELQRMEQQLRASSATGIQSGNSSGGMPTTGHSTQFLNMGGYFPGR